MTNRVSSRHAIPHPLEFCTLVGVLEQLESEEPRRGRKIALVLHGAMGHKDYLYQKRIARELPMDTFRFDFRGNYESGGLWRYGGFTDDVQDIQIVVDHLKSAFGYVVDLIIAHSRGASSAFNWCCTSPDAKDVTAFVNVSGRYRMRMLRDACLHDWEADFNTSGYHEIQAIVAGRPILARAFPADLEDVARFDMALVWDKFPSHIDVLTIHGLADEVVPSDDACIYSRALSTRTPGSHNLHLMEGTDHLFTGRQDEVIKTILDWFDLHQRKKLTTGIWHASIRSTLGKL